MHVFHEKVAQPCIAEAHDHTHRPSCPIVPRHDSSGEFDERDDVWLSDFGSNALVRFDPDTETFVSVPLSDPGSNVRQILGRPGQVRGAASGVDKPAVARCA